MSLIHSGSRPLPDRTTPRSRNGTQPDRPLIGCWVTRQWSNGLGIDHRPADWIDDTKRPLMAMGAGLVMVAVAREHAEDEVSVCGYLVDTYCLGIKNAVRPNVVDRHGLADFITDYFQAYPAEPLPAPLSLAQDLVFGAVEYAERLGFEPHSDFYQAKPHLGSWQPPSRIRFGFHGRPCFQQGPYDNPARVQRILNRSVGPGNFSFITQVSP